MANDEHVALLKQGVNAWNAWREKSPGIRPDLRGAGLREEYLRKANLRRARNPPDGAHPRRRGDRIERLFAAVHMAAIGT
jgi:hypothetical protein